MFLIQRLMGVGIYAICAFVFYCIIPRFKGLNIHLDIYCFLLALMGFFYVPMLGSDLSRLYAVLHVYSNMSSGDIWNAMMSSSTPIAVLYYHIVGKLGDDRLLPCLTALLTYSCVFAIIKSYYKKNSINKDIISIVLLFFMARGLLMSTIANIRTMLALSFIAFSIYKILFEKRPFIKYALFLVIGALIHVTGLASFLLFFAYYLIRKLKDQNKLLSVFEWIILLAGIIKLGQTYIMEALDKGLVYLEYAQSGTGYFYIWEMILSMIVIMFSIIVICNYYRLHCKILLSEDEATERDSYSSYIGFVFVLAIVTLICILIEFNIGERLSYLLSILDIPLFMMLLNSKRYQEKDYRRLHNQLFILSVVLMAIACSRGDLCSLKFF